MSTRQDFQRFVRNLAAEYSNIQTVRLGRLDGATVETGTSGLLWARQWNGKEIKVINQAHVPSDFDLRVLVGVRRTQPGKWFVLQVMEDYLTPATEGRVAYHHPQHELGGADEVAVHRKQIFWFTVRVLDAAGYIVRVYGGYFPSVNGFGYTPTQSLDLSSFVTTAGAKFVAIEVDDNGTLSTHEGTAFGSPLIGTINDVPSPEPGKYHVAAVRFYDGQTELAEEDIIVPFPLGVIAKNAGLQINEADADTPANSDEFGWWDVVDQVLKKITWANLKAALGSVFNPLVTFREADASPSLSNVSTIKVSNGLLVDNGSGSISIYHFEPLTNSDPSDPQLVFDPGTGDLIMVAKE